MLGIAFFFDECKKIPSKIGGNRTIRGEEVSIGKLGLPGADLWTFLCDGKRDTNLVVWHPDWLSVLAVPLGGIVCLGGWGLVILCDSIIQLYGQGVVAASTARAISRSR